MESINQLQDVGRFDVIFEKLEEAKKEQNLSFPIELDSILEINKTILLFKEYQESFTESSYSIFTRS
ncbi:hypothetical protein [Terrimonas alba]|uniref:hypothetical protein n=1 Tax=Terrimonas alba TaxID=3349636 RepID=UPI0035F2B2D3